MFESFRESNGILPLILGVTGHRDLRPEDLPGLRRQMNRVLQKIRDHWFRLNDEKTAPLYLLSGMATGADQLAVEVALEMGIGIIAVLPMPLGQYEEDFTNPDELARLRSLMARVAGVVTLPQEGGTREFQYEAAGTYISRNCSLLIALWDGVHVNRIGGTSHVVRMKLYGADSNVDGPLPTLELDLPGPVCHIHTLRRGSTEKSNFTIRVLRTDEEGSGVITSSLDQKDSLGESVERQGEFNADWTGLAPRLENQAQAAAQSLPPSAKSSSEEEHLRGYFGVAEVLSSYFQRQSIRMVNWYFGLLLLAGTILEASYYYFPAIGKATDKSDNNIWIDVAYLVVMVVLWILFLYAKRKDFHNRYHEYRALAEALRVQYFWRAAGLHHSVADHYLAHQLGEMDWICKALYTINLPLSAPSSADFSYLRDHWVKDQLQYFKRSVKKNARLSNRLNLGGVIALGGSMLWVVLRIGAEPIYDWISEPLKPYLVLVLMLFASTSVMALVLFGYNHFRGFSEHAKRHAAMIPLFEMALRVLSRPQSDEVARKVVLQLGQEALAENGYWLILHHQQELDLA